MGLRRMSPCIKRAADRMKEKCKRRICPVTVKYSVRHASIVVYSSVQRCKVW
jgi:hypothetical protein